MKSANRFAQKGPYGEGKVAKIQNLYFEWRKKRDSGWEDRGECFFMRLVAEEEEKVLLEATAAGILPRRAHGVKSESSNSEEDVIVKQDMRVKRKPILGKDRVKQESLQIKKEPGLD